MKKKYPPPAHTVNTVSAHPTVKLCFARKKELLIRIFIVKNSLMMCLNADQEDLNPYRNLIKMIFHYNL